MKAINDLPVHPAADLFPMLDDTELRELADDIAANGLHEPLWVWDDPGRGPVLLDGRNRLAACKLAGVRPATRAYIGDDPVSFVISENVRRRHLTAMQKAGVAVRALPLYEAQTNATEARRKSTSLQVVGSVEDSTSTEAALPQSQSAESPPRRRPQSRDKAAKTAGTSGRSVAQYKRIAEQAPDLLAKVDSGELSGDRAERIIRDRIAERARIEQARKEAEAQPEPTRVDIRHGDFREVLADVADVDAIITDPPYSREYLPLLADLAAWADKVLKPDGVLAVLMGNMFLPDVYRLLEGGRPYRWTACYLTPGQSEVNYPRRLTSNWKPLLVYGHGPRFADVFRAEGRNADAKSNHKWGQDYGAFHSIIERLTERSQTVSDPFMGSGTTLLAAHALGRHAIGCDIDAEHVAKAKERLS